MFTPGPVSCKSYMNEGVSRSMESGKYKSATELAMCNGYFVSKGIAARPGKPEWAAEHPDKAGGRRRKQQTRRQRKGRKSGKSRRNRH